MILPIVLLDESLHQKCEELHPSLIKNISRDLFETLRDTPGFGLAAPQVGLNYRIFVSNYCDPRTQTNNETFVNPVILGHSEDTVNEFEGCLSIPGIHERVERWREVTIKYLDVNGNEKTQTFTGLMSRIVQHEIDHLDGIVFTDKLSKVRLKKLRHKIEDIKNRLVNVEYRIK